jgi:zinc/manganese transport system substrate-binding protein
LDETEDVDRSKGDIHPGGNPHYLYDPRQLEHVAIAVSAALMRLDPDHAAAHKKRLGTFLAGLHKLRQKLENEMKPFKGQAVISYHRSWVYLTDWLGLKTVAHLEPKPGIPPNPSHVAKVLVAARRHHVKALIQESFYPSATAELVAEKSGAKVVSLPGGANFSAGQHVLAYLASLVEQLEKGLK